MTAGQAAPAPLKPLLFYVDRSVDSSAELREVLALTHRVVHFHALDGCLHALEADPGTLALFDVATLADSPTSRVGQLVEFRGRAPLALVTDLKLEDYISHLRTWGMLQILVKQPPINPEEVAIFLDSVEDPSSAFGLIRYLSKTIEMYNQAVRTLEEKRIAIERVINHFATNGFDIHELYDVRLILEEMINNAFFHAFHRASGEEKYTVRDFQDLEEGESVRIEYGSDSRTVGFTVTDNAGSLRIKTILSKLERQYNREGIFEESGRGLYLSRMLASQMILNIDSGHRTQAIALFDDRRKSDRAKPLMINYTGPSDFDEWGIDPELE